MADNRSIRVIVQVMIWPLQTFLINLHPIYLHLRCAYIWKGINMLTLFRICADSQLNNNNSPNIYASNSVNKWNNILTSMLCTHEPPHFIRISTEYSVDALVSLCSFSQFNFISYQIYTKQCFSHGDRRFIKFAWIRRRVCVQDIASYTSFWNAFYA